MSYPVFERADWNEFIGGSHGMVNVPLHVYEDERFPFDVKPGDKCIVIENEEMHGALAEVVSVVDDPTDAFGTPLYVEVKLL